jgi:Xaa-Pro dipeptidase
MAMDLHNIQKAIKEFGLDGWLFYDFHNRDPIAYRILGLDFGKFTSRRWFYYIPSKGEPIRLVHKVEPTKLDSLPGKKQFYLAWEGLHKSLKQILGPAPKKIAMQYSPMNNIPYVSMVDGGTIELIKQFGYEIISSADLVQIFEAVIDEAGYRSHIDASQKIYQIKEEAFHEIGKAIRENREVTEYDIQQFIVRRFKEEKLTCMGEWSIVGVNDHPANPHFEPTKENTYVIKKGDKVLIDLWAKLDQPGSIFSDITWCGFVGKRPPEKYVKIFGIARDARKAALKFVKDRFEKNKICYGWEVDEACRNVIKNAGYGEYFIHRTGHSIGEEVHGNGVHIDNLETKEERQLIPGICFSIEPGIYLEGEMAVRTEIDVFITLDRKIVVAGEEQEELILID